MYESLTYTLSTGEELFFERFGRIYMTKTRWCGKSVILIAESDPYTEGICKYSMGAYDVITDDPESWEQAAIEQAVYHLADRAADCRTFSEEAFSAEAFAADLVISEIHLHSNGFVTFCFMSAKVFGEHVLVLVRCDTASGLFYEANILY